MIHAKDISRPLCWPYFVIHIELQFGEEIMLLISWVTMPSAVLQSYCIKQWMYGDADKVLAASVG